MYPINHLYIPRMEVNLAEKVADNFGVFVAPTYTPQAIYKPNLQFISEYINTILVVDSSLSSSFVRS